MSADEREYLKPETVVIGPDGRVLARIEAAFWPPIAATVQLGDPSRNAVVREVRLELHPVHAVVCITVDVDEASSGGDA